MNQTPIANAGADRTVSAGAAVTLDGSKSSDPDNDPLTFSWRQTAGQTVSLTNPKTAKPTFRAPSGSATVELEFELTVSDGNTTSTDTVTITVNRYRPPSPQPRPEWETNPVRIVSTRRMTVVEQDSGRTRVTAIRAEVVGTPPPGYRVETSGTTIQYCVQVIELRFRIRLLDGKVVWGPWGKTASPETCSPSHPPTLRFRLVRL